MAMSLDAIVLATDPLSQVRIAGLAVRERAVRVAKRVGASRVHVVESDASRAALVAWRGSATGPLLVIRADQLVHTPLAQPIVATGNTAIAVVPERPPVDDLTAGEYAGAFVVGGEAAAEVIAGLARGDTDVAIVAKLTDAQRIPHGEIARAPIATRDQRRAATR